ncbi:MAG: ATP-binding cassette domain-containing protein, partial [Cyanobacteria bacterium P01_F01_bin.42]
IVQPSDRIQISDLDLRVPHSDRTLLTQLSLVIEPQQNLLITGESGTGKSSLLRAIAGLWQTNGGHIHLPDRLMFLPQTPYLIPGSIREQLQYPSSSGFSDQNLLQILRRVNLEYLFSSPDDLDNATANLSAGERQRIAVGRVLLHQPDFAFLDEATSALDLANEHQLYAQLEQSQTTLISVGHRDSLRRYHYRELRLKSAGDWSLEAIAP